MEVQYNKQYSHNLGREMEWKQYGHAGQGVLVFPSQDQRFYEWEDQCMIDVLAPMIERGLIHLICCDSIDVETWSLTEGNQQERNFFFRRPDLFCSLLSLSGLFHADYFFPEFTSETIWRNSPLHFLTCQNDPSLLLDAYRGKQIILCCGQGNYEDITCPSTQRLGALLQEKNIPAWVDIWGTDVDHDFVWWRRQAQYFFDYLINNKQYQAA